MEPSRTDLHKDLEAAVQTRKELGPEYEAEIVDSFLARIDAQLDARVERRVAERLTESGRAPRRPERSFAPRLPIISLALAIPLSGVGAGVSGLPGLLVVWTGIVGVNIAASLGEWRERREEREARRRRRDGWD
ncbi:hypothetical protein [Peterkaempfera bronchialis]|uniref:Integral membrane protein n=1 Tax=Peterkaempfera bronchialis TaxID=2126346 RepID=A0A345SVV9_9ACTN|nr:hypothetical protein [Peterkaempfera bronchialis]AXI77864.1 hypothetical protein C7M71_010870 [Peterkaempfera bronchialis]